MVEMVPIQPVPLPEGPLGDPAWPLFIVNGNRDHLIVYAEIDEYGEPHLLSALPDLGRNERRMTWLEYELDEWGSLGGLMRLDMEDPGAAPFSDEDWTWWCLYQGYCPGQVLIVELVAHYSKDYCWEAGCYEYDFSLSFDILSAEHLPLHEHAERWIEAFKGYDKTWTEQGQDPILRDFR
jgi:hypothetical protein